MFLLHPVKAMHAVKTKNRTNVPSFCKRKKFPSEPGQVSLFATAKLGPLALFGPDPAKASGSTTVVVPHALIPGYL